MTYRRMRRRLLKALSRGHQLQTPNPDTPAMKDPKDLAAADPICKFFGRNQVDDKGWFDFQAFAIALEEAFGIQISDVEAEELYLGTIDEAIAWTRNRMRYPADISGGVAIPVPGPATEELELYQQRVKEAHHGLNPHLYHSYYCSCGLPKSRWSSSCSCGLAYD